MKKFIKISTFAGIHEELKKIYMKELKDQFNFFKFQLIPIKVLFKDEEKLKNFEEVFKIKENVIKYISCLFKFVEYEKTKEILNKNIESNFSNGNYYLNNDNKKENNNENYDGEKNIDNNNSGYSSQSIKFINGIFKNGVEVANFGESNLLQGFTINSCDPSNMGIALGLSGHKKVNVLFNLLIRKRTEGNF